MKTADPIRCPYCGVAEGYLHQEGCTAELCPFCGWPLYTCDCSYDQLGLYDADCYDSATAFLPPEVYANGLSAEQSARWAALLAAKGRVPYYDADTILAANGGTIPATEEEIAAVAAKLAG